MWALLACGKAPRWNLECFVSRLLEWKRSGRHRRLPDPEAGGLLYAVWQLPPHTLSESQTLHVALGHQKHLCLRLVLHFSCVLGYLSTIKAAEQSWMWLKNENTAAPREPRSGFFHSKLVRKEREVNVSWHISVTRLEIWLFCVGLVKLHIITGTEYSNFTFTAEYKKNVVDGILCINWHWFSIMNIGYWMLEIKINSHSCSNYALVIFWKTNLSRNGDFFTKLWTIPW